MALENPGSGNYAIRTTGGFFDPRAMTVCFWYFIESDRNASSAIVGLRDTAVGNYVYYYNSNGDGTTFHWEDGTNAQLDFTSKSLSTWYFVALSRAGTGANQTTHYRKSPGDTAFTSATGTFGDSGTTINEEIVLANGFGVSTSWFPGRIAGLKQWNAALSAAELWEESQRLTPVRLNNLHSWRPMVDGSVAGSVVDYSGNGRNLTPNGTLAIADGPPVTWDQGTRRIFLPLAAGGGNAVALDALAIGRNAVRNAAQIAIAFSARAIGETATRTTANMARTISSRASGVGRTLASSSVARAVSASILAKSSTQATANAARSFATRTAGGVRTVANTAIARALAVRTAGRTAAQLVFDAAGVITGNIRAAARVIGSLSMARALSAGASGRGAARIAASVARALVGRVNTGSAARASQIVARSFSSIVRAGSIVKASLPPLVQEVVGIVRALLRASMAGVPIRATGKISAPIVVSATNMIAKNVVLKDYVIGDDTEIAFELTDWPAGVTLAKAYLTIKRSLDDADADAILQRDISATLTVKGQITANGSTGTATGYFLIRHQDSEWAEIKPRGPYHFDIQPITDQATVQTPIIGTIAFQKGATDATI